MSTTISKSFTSVSSGPSLTTGNGDSYTATVSGVFSGTVLLEASKDGGQSWGTAPVRTYTAAGSETIQVESKDGGLVQHRFRCSAYVSGTIVTSLADADQTLKEFRDQYGATVMKITEAGVQIPGTLFVGGSQVVPGSGFVGGSTRTRFSQWVPPTLTGGTATTASATSVYVSQILIETGCTITGGAFLANGTVGTNKYIIALFDNTGAPIANANSSIAGILTSGGNTFQTANFALAQAVPAGVYYLGVYFNGATDGLQTIPAAASGTGTAIAITAQTFGTIAAITPPTSFAGNAAPVSFVF